MTIYEALSVIGALTGTSVLCWDVFKWKTKHTNVSIEVATDMLFDSPTSKSDNKKTWVAVTITNLGDNPVTLNSLSMSYYATRVMQFRKKPKRLMIVNPLCGTLPHKPLEGGYWLGAIHQTSELEKMAKKGILVANMDIAGRKRPKRARIKIQ